LRGNIKNVTPAVAVGTALAGCPPHRSGLEGLPHPAPTSGNDAEAFSASRTRSSPLNRLIPSLRPVPVELQQVPLGQTPSLHHLRRPVTAPIRG
jgi:hypothetical protein